MSRSKETSKFVKTLSSIPNLLGSLIMNNDEKFQQRWEFRRREVNGDSSSDDSRSNSSGDPTVKNHKLCTDIILPENDNAICTTICQRDDKLEETKIKKKNVVKKKPKKCPVKENKRKRKVNSEEMVISKDLKIFGDSLIDELKVARENMFAHMREEMKKLVDLRSNLEKPKKNVKCSKKTKPPPRKANVKSQNCPRGSDASKFSKGVTTNELQEGEKSRPSTKTRAILANDSSDQVVSSSYLTLPTVVPKPQFQNQRNCIPPLNSHILAMNNSSSEMEIGKLMDAKKTYQQFQAFHNDGQFGSSSCKSVGQKSSVGFPVPLHQVLDNSSNMSSTLTYTENSFLNNSKVGPRMNATFVRFPNSNMPYKSDDEFVSQLMRNQRWPILPTNLRNEQ